MTGWIKYLWGCDWSKENDIFDSCQVLSSMNVRFSTILTRGFLFSRLGASISASRRKFPNRKNNIKRKPLGPGYRYEQSRPKS